MKKALIALAIAAISTAASAQQTTARYTERFPGWYAGIGVGQSNTRFKSGDFNTGVAGISENKDENDTAWKIFAGYNITPMWGVEAGFTDLGRPKYTYSAAGGLNAEAKLRQHAFFVAGKATWPINERFNIFGKLGVTANYARLSVNSNIPAVSGSDNHTRADLMGGVGAEFMFHRNMGVRAEYEHYGRFGNANDTGRTRADLWSASLVFRY